MKKRVISLLTVFSLLFGLTTMASAAEGRILSLTRASRYLDDYSVGIEARGSGKIAVSMLVYGVGIMDKIGVREVYIEQKVDGVWEYYDTLDAVDHPEFYDYDSRDFLETTYFYGDPGETYRVTLTVYARNSNGSDTGYITSYSEVCK